MQHLFKVLNDINFWVLSECHSPNRQHKDGKIIKECEIVIIGNYVKFNILDRSLVRILIIVWQLINRHSIKTYQL